jgi:predicted AAA+ superfamily ATPase
VRSFYHNLSANVGYYRQATDKEIDIVVDYIGTQILIEVKYRENYSFSKSAPIISDVGKATSAMVVTKKENDFGELEANPFVYRIPAYAFLYLLGHAERHGYKKF